MLNMNREIFIVLQFAIVLPLVRFPTGIDHELTRFFFHITVAEARNNKIKVFFFYLADFCLRH